MSQETRYEVGTKVIFNSAHGESSRNGEEAEVLLHGNGRDKSGVAHAIKFADDHRMWAYPQELTPVG